jgi:hypothetical protein
MLLISNSVAFYYVEQKSISLNETVKPLYYAQTPVTEIFSLETEIESDLVNNVECYITSPVTFSKTTYVSVGSNRYNFTCSFIVSGIGRAEVSIRYSSSPFFSFSSNTVSMVFVEKRDFEPFSPNVGLTNITSKVVMLTKFKVADYFLPKYITKYSIFNNQTNLIQTASTNFTETILEVIEFTTEFFVPDALTYYVSIWIEKFGKQLEIVNPQPYKFVGLFFFSLTPQIQIISHQIMETSWEERL